MITLENILKTQDMGQTAIDKICNEVLRDKFDANTDPLSAIIVNTFNNNLYGKYRPEESDFDSCITDIDYAITQLTKARNFIAKEIAS